MKPWSQIQKELVFELNEENLHYMPAERRGPGVYKLYHHKDLIYISWTDRSLHAEITAHFKGTSRCCTMMATHYWYQETEKGKARERALELLKEYIREYCRLPRCHQY